MPQADIGNIDPNETSGAELAQLLTNFGSAAKSLNRGATRPPYAVRGTMWIQDNGGNQLNVFVFTGAADVLIGTINVAANTFTASNAGTTLGGIGAVPSARRVNTLGSIQGGGDLSADRTLALINDHAAPPPGYYYGTDGAGSRGWFPMPGQRGLSRMERMVWTWATGGFFGISVPPNVNRLVFTIIGGGGANFSWQETDGGEGGSGQTVLRTALGGRGATVCGLIVVSPGQGINIRVGGVGEYTEIGGYIAAGPGGNASQGVVGTPGAPVLATGIDLSQIGYVEGGPVLRNSSGALAGEPGTHGSMILDFVTA